MVRCALFAHPSMKHSHEQLEAARDLLADGASRADAAKAIAHQFGVSNRTGERVVAAVADDTASSDMSDTPPPSDTDAPMRDYLSMAYAALADSITAARATGDAEALASRGEQLAGIIAKTKVRWAV